MGKTLRLGIMILAIGLMMAAVGYYVATGSRFTQATQQSPTEQKLRLANLAGDCESSVGDDGYGVFKVERPTVISSEDGEIGVPCKIRLERGGSLALNDVNLRTKNLVVSDYGSNGESKIRIEDSMLTGVGQTAFFVQLSDAADSIAIESSTLDYPGAIWTRAFGPVDGGDPDGGRVNVTASTLRSLGPETEGIQLIVGSETGVGNFVDLQIETVQLDPDLDPRARKALLVAGECRMERVTGYGDAVCDPEDALLQEQQ